MLKAKKLKIAAQIEAESDAFLFECFHDNGVIEELVDNRYGLIAGRKGTGKTAIARYLEREHKEYGIDYAARLTLSELQVEGISSRNLDGENLLRFLAIKTAQKLLRNKLLSDDGMKFWEDYLSRYGLQHVSTYKDLVVRSKRVKSSVGAGLGLKKIMGAEVNQDTELEYESQLISDSPSILMGRLGESLKENKKIIIVVDDLTDQLDRPDSGDIKAFISQIKYVLHELSIHNSRFNDDGVDLTFVCTIREDLWEFISGSNENKLISNCLWLTWDEKSFCQLLIKRLPHFTENLEEALESPFESIKDVFPDEVFEDVFRQKNIKPESIKQYKTRFYSYVQLISFNRPRDFLRLCHAMKPRLSKVKPVEAKHIRASEYEYEAYFFKELKDELNIFALILNLEVRQLMQIMSKLSEKSEMSYSELKAILSKYIKGNHSNTLRFIEILWSYSLLGIVKPKSYVRFKHNQSSYDEENFPDEQKLKGYYFMLHRGLYWKYVNMETR